MSEEGAQPQVDLFNPPNTHHFNCFNAFVTPPTFPAHVSLSFYISLLIEIIVWQHICEE